MTAESLTSYLDFTTETAYLAGRLTMGYFQAGIQPDFKADDSPVTAADRQAEELIRSCIEKRYPAHAIVGEEFGANELESADHRWIIDPIDGTKSFVHGVPLFGVLIGLEIEGQVEVGAAYFPALDEMISAATGLGCWWNGRRAHVSDVDQMERAVVTCTEAGSFARNSRGEAWERITRAAYFQAGWGDAYGYSLVATGRVELMMDAVMNVWDCGPFPPILRESGGFFGDWLGNTSIYAGEAIAVNQRLLPQVLSLIEGH